MTLRGSKSEKLASDLAQVDQEKIQYLFQRVTVNFTRGNEHQKKQK